MSFYMPTRVYEESDCVKRHAAELASFGKRALLVTGKHSARENGSLEDVTKALEQEGRTFCTFSDVEENPSVETILAAGAYGIGQGADFVIGIGGGSPLDAAKAIALVMKHPEVDVNYLYDAGKDSTTLPVVAVPTTSGTGSEVTGVSVLTRHDKRTKMSIAHKIFPAMALIDGRYLAYAPHKLIVNTAMDALAHLLESALSARADAYSNMAVTAGLTAWKQSGDVLAKKRTPLREDYMAMMRASAFAGIAIAQTGTALPHALSYVITYERKLAHGRAVGYFLPRFLQEAPALDRERLLALAGFEDLAQFTAYLQYVFDGEMYVPEESLARTYDAVRTNPAKMSASSFPVDEDVLRRIVWGQ